MMIDDLMIIYDDLVMIYDVDDEDEDEEDNENPSAAVGSGLRLSMIRTSPMLISLTSDLPSHQMHIQVHTGAYVSQ